MTAISQSRAAPAMRARRVMGQGALLLAAFGLGQGFSLARNALLGHWLSKGDFGVAATITLALQLVEVLSDFAVDRHVVQAEDGDDPRLVASAHTFLIARGVLVALALYAASVPIAGFFRIEDAAWAFQAAALAPLLRGFSHLDARRYQRRYDNRAYAALEILPQALGLALMAPALRMLEGYQAVVAVLVAQALIHATLSQALAERPYRIAIDRRHVLRFLAFGWPIWLSAFPLVAVYQGERVLVGRLFGIEALAGFTVAFMATMVPGLAAAKVGQALMLPLLAQVRAQPHRFMRRLRLMAEANTLAAAIYATLVLLTAEQLLPLAFGPAYRGLGALAGCLALMWMVRMVQAVPGMALMALGVTRPLLVAGCIRALALPAAFALALMGHHLVEVVAMGIVGELASLVYVSLAAGAVQPGLARVILRRSLFLVPAIALAGVLAHIKPAQAGIVVIVAVALGAVSALAMAALAVMPAMRRFVETRTPVRRRRPRA